MTWNRFENVSSDNPMPVQEVSGTYNAKEPISASNPLPVMEVDGAYSNYENVSSANPQPVAIIADSGAYTRYEEYSDTNAFPVKFIEGQSYDPRFDVSETNPWPVLVVSGGGEEYEGPLDLVSGAAVAYSLSRALSAAFIGENVVTLRRDSDDAEMIFATGEDGLVDVSAVTSWLDGASGFVSKVWDQSGNANHMLQADTSKQPPWVVDAAGGRPAFQAADGLVALELRCGEISYPNGGLTGYMVFRGRAVRFIALNTAPADMEFNCGLYPSPEPIYLQDADGNDCGIGSPDSAAASLAVYHLTDARGKFADCDSFLNGIDVAGESEFTDGVGPISPFTIDPTRWLITGSNTGQTRGSAEVIVWPTFPGDPDRLLLRQNIATHYGITL